VTAATLSTDAHEGRSEKLKRTQELDRVSTEAPSCLKTFKAAFSGKSLRAGINAMCLQCTCFDRLYIRDCPSSNCGLWPYRPFQKMKGRSQKKEGVQ